MLTAAPILPLLIELDSYCFLFTSDPARMLAETHFLSPDNCARLYNLLRTEDPTDCGAYAASQKLRKNNKLASVEFSIIECQHAGMKDMLTQITLRKKEPRGEYP